MLENRYIKIQNYIILSEFVLWNIWQSKILIFIIFILVFNIQTIKKRDTKTCDYLLPEVEIIKLLEKERIFPKYFDLVENNNNHKVLF